MPYSITRKLHSEDGTSLTLKLENGRTIEAHQQVLIAYSPDLDSINYSTAGGGSGIDTLTGSSGSDSLLSDTSGNELQAFTFNVVNNSGEDFTAPVLSASPTADANGESFKLNFSDFSGSLSFDDQLSQLAFSLAVGETRFIPILHRISRFFS